MKTPAQPSKAELILYTTEDGQATVHLRVAEGTVWLTQLEIAELFQTTKQNVSLHTRNILGERELREESVVKDSLTTAADGKRYSTKVFNLEMILAVGYRVRSPRGTQFRQWATTRLREFLVKGFVMDDARLKQPGGVDYFDELLARIREIRASEKRFYQKVRDIYATSVDYDARSEAAQAFFKKVQNKMLWAVTGQTAAELIAERSAPLAPNMGLTTWSGSRVRKHDVTVAKNYLQKSEIQELGRIVVMYLDYAEDQAQKRRTATMKDWSDRLDAFLRFNERELLTHPGKVRAEVAEALARDRFEAFEAERRKADAIEADADDLKALESIGRRGAKKAPGSSR